MEDKLIGGATTQIIINSAKNGKIELTDKLDIDAAILENNEKKYHMTEGSSQLLTNEAIELFGKYHYAPYPTKKYLEHQYGDWEKPKRTSDKDLYLTNKYYGKNSMIKLFKNFLIFLKILK